ncbi:MAG TPA: glucose PTS transporter subunit IIA, partial [Rhizomicrobium sp.]
MANLVLVAPMAGWVAPLKEVPDPVFAERLLGDGVAIDPVSATLHAPCDGVIVSSAAHAVTIRAANGAEILIHIGLETVALGGQGFVVQAREGRSVKTGDPLIAFDLDSLALRAKSLISPVIVVNGDAFTIARREFNKRVATGEFLMELVPVGTTAVSEQAASNEREALVRLAHGIHARPAAMLANAAKRFSADVSLSMRNRTANARSVAALMSLGVQHGDRVTIRASGSDAEMATADLARLIETGLGETPVDAPPRSSASQRVPQLESVAQGTGVLRGLCASPGAAFGPVSRFRRAEIEVRESGRGIAAETVALENALAEVRTRLELAAAHGNRQRRDILGAHIALLEDPEILRSAHAAIVEGKSAAYGVRATLRSVVADLEQNGDGLLRERAQDMLDIERQLLAMLTGGVPRSVSAPAGSIVVADDILPSELMQLEQSRISALCLARGGPTSHVAILARGINLPALVSTGPAVLNVVDGTNAILNADAGMLRLDPDEAAIAAVRGQTEQRTQKLKQALARAHQECRTADGVRIEAFANLGAGTAEAKAAAESGAEGCGLLRTEFLFLDRAAAPDEEEQALAYQAIADSLGGRPLIIRTLDIGGDKPVPYLPMAS